MTEHDDVPRWLDADSGASDELRALLASATDDDPTPSELARLGDRLAPELGPGGSGAAPARFPLRLGLGIGLGVGVLGALAVIWSTTRSPVPPALRSSLAGLTLPKPQLDERAEAPLPVTSIDSLAPERLAPAPSASVPKESEIAMLERAHAALRSGRAVEALAVTVEHARAYPRGMLSQEREVIAVEALARSGRRAEAEARGNAFIQRFPGSSHARRLRAILGIADGGS